jgi:hypothetical protein
MQGFSIAPVVEGPLDKVPEALLSAVRGGARGQPGR